MNRKPAVAGRFYSAAPKQLHADVLGFLAEAESGDHRSPKALIVPHAGYVYSGPVAASAYVRLMSRSNAIRRVVLIGPSHHLGFQGLALSQVQAYSTPLGDVELDTQAITDLLTFPFVEIIEQAHIPEHSLEVQLPFLQTVLSDFKLLPIITGEATPEEVAAVLAVWWDDHETLLVVSSDLSHYQSYALAQQHDSRTSRMIEQLDYLKITAADACGKVPVCGLLKLLADKGLAIQAVDLRNSGDTAGDKQRVVGYGAYVVN